MCQPRCREGRPTRRADEVRADRLRSGKPNAVRLSRYARRPAVGADGSADRPFLLFDFDFGTLNAEFQSVRPRRDFSFALPFIWPQEKGFLRYLGRLDANYTGFDLVGETPAVRFDLTLEGPQPSTGSLRVDQSEWYIFEAELSIPNHENNRDFRLKLQKIEPGGQSAWDTLLTRHYSHCPKAR